MPLRVIPKGRGELDARAGGRVHVYASDGRFTLLEGSRACVDDRPYTPPKSTAARYLEAEHIPPRDWGWDWYPLPIFGYEPDVGVFLGAGALAKTYAFRKHPWSTRHVLTAGWAFQAAQPRVSYNGAFRPRNSQLVGKVEARYSGIEVVGFYGFGNDTSDDGTNRFFRAKSEEAYLAFELETPVGTDALKASAGPWLSALETEDGNRLINQLDPYGSGDFHSIGATARLRWDTRTSLEGRDTALELGLHENPAAGYPTHGSLVELRGLVSPEAWDVESTWGSLRGSAAAYASVGAQDRFTFAARAGGEAVFGRYPYRGAAYLGGGNAFTGDSTIRGYRPQRYAGDEMVFGNLDLRVVLTRAKLVFPGDVGVLAFVDGGRVFLDGDGSDDFHWSTGGGLWFAPLVRTNAISLTVAYSPQDTLFYLRQGFHF
jgi:hypothetical protein